ncbi:hypothetical protein CSW98_10105 [Vibrio sp. HA2012]|uniref:endonuclease/exonuclease/phosphatase family protein n=1 Tax=Vibrio sp. HA2012 TaxID=1971595 RepID=UPI000C2C9782|nr:endonuclease/exonuclease/phosphatase family protein [Vibrio sp. HA2012]PJC86547.1 hypothetical protein CSW98_10105 [Vibrio sp. HA2012]
MKKLFSAFLLLLTGLSFLFLLIFDIPESPFLMVTTPHHRWQATGGQCSSQTFSPVLDNHGTLSVLVWNIYKENRSGWQETLERLSRNAQLLLLQEGSLNEEFSAWIEDNHWQAAHTSAFNAFGVSAGVLNLSRTAPQRVCAYTQTEPWLRLPKSALYARYSLSDGQTLAVINIHAVNFTLGVKEYSEQLEALREAVSGHSGPLIVAGDFNSWSSHRMNVLQHHMQQLGLDEVSFHPDNREEILTGYKLDHLFFRGLTPIKAEAPVTDASDHNPMSVHFVILP